MREHRKRFNQKYWGALLRYMAEREMLRHPRNPYTDNSQIIDSWPEASIRSAAKFNRKLKWIHVDLTLDGPDAKQRFRELEKDKGAIQRQVGATSGEWFWKEREGLGEEAHIILRMDSTNPNDEKDWSRQHAWMAKTLVAFRAAFESRIKALN
jgi:hypothetical protein